MRIGMNPEGVCFRPQSIKIVNAGPQMCARFVFAVSGAYRGMLLKQKVKDGVQLRTNAVILISRTLILQRNLTIPV